MTKYDKPYIINLNNTNNVSEGGDEKMFEITYVIDGLQKKMRISANDSIQATEVFTNMYGVGFGNIQIIDVRRI